MGDEAAAHEKLCIFLGAYVLGALQDDDRCAELEAHLRACGPCRAELPKLADVATRLAAENEDPRSEVWERIHHRTRSHGTCSS
ncbi:MAG: zf-HC2 domain-containing protein [Actinomycetota bacterium]|nr:zf-HC2 domain-containing protein [Actinomycetota bacterium]